MSKITVRTARLEDAAAIWEIYRYYVERTAISFEITMPTAEQMRQRIEKVLAAYPYLVAEAEGKILGYAYAGPFIPREAYAHCAEVSIYISRENRRRGIGRLLYDELTADLSAMGIAQLYACIGVPEQEDEYLNNNSAEFHAHLGFREVGRFRNSGRKFGRSYHMIWMEKVISDV
jgi:phosphinothricin acetyltransferase